MAKTVEDRKQEMLAAIAEDYLYSARLTGLSAPGEKTAAALAAVPREKFVPVAMQPFAWENRPLSIGAGQTISQPFIVALMTDLLQPQASDTILEIGTGSGYQAAILSRLVRQVFSIEIVPVLAESAAARLAALGYTNVEVRHGDGRSGWPGQAPFEGIIVTAGADDVPPALIDQLKPGGRLVIPVRQGYRGEQLLLLAKEATGAVTAREVLPVAFVPLTGGSG